MCGFGAIDARLQEPARAAGIRTADELWVRDAKAGLPSLAAALGLAEADLCDALAEQAVDEHAGGGKEFRGSRVPYAFGLVVVLVLLVAAFFRRPERNVVVATRPLRPFDVVSADGVALASRVPTPGAFGTLEDAVG